MISNINAQVLPIIPSPILEGYRNKVEFTCGWNEWIPSEEGDLMKRSQVTVGFLAGLYRDGVVTVLVSSFPLLQRLMHQRKDPSRCKHVGPKSKLIAATFQAPHFFSLLSLND